MYHVSVVAGLDQSELQLTARKSPYRYGCTMPLMNGPNLGKTVNKPNSSGKNQHTSELLYYVVYTRICMKVCVRLYISMHISVYIV